MKPKHHESRKLTAQVVRKQLCYENFDDGVALQQLPYPALKPGLRGLCFKLGSIAARPAITHVEVVTLHELSILQPLTSIRRLILYATTLIISKLCNMSIFSASRQCSDLLLFVVDFKSSAGSLWMSKYISIEV